MKQAGFLSFTLFVAIAAVSQSVHAQWSFERTILARGITEGFTDELDSNDAGYVDGARSIGVLNPAVLLKNTGKNTTTGLRLGAHLMQATGDDEEAVGIADAKLYADTNIENFPISIKTELEVRETGRNRTRSVLAFDPVAQSYDPLVYLSTQPKIETTVGFNNYLNGSYRFDYITSLNDAVVPSTNHQLELEVGTQDLARGRLGWFFDGRFDRYQVEGNDDNLTDAYGLVGLKTLIADDWQIHAGVGQQLFTGNSAVLDLPESNPDENESDFIWDVGLTYQPKRDTFIQAVYGERIIGAWPRFTVTHINNDKNTTLDVSWAREIARPGANLFGETTGLNDNGDEISRNRLSLIERATIAYEIEGRASLINFSASLLKSLAETDDGIDDDRTIVQASYERRFSSRWSWLLSVSDGRETNNSSNILDPTYKRVGVGIRYASCQRALKSRCAER